MKQLIIICLTVLSLTSFGQGGTKFTVKGNGSGGSNVGDSVKKNTDTLVVYKGLIYPNGVNIQKNTDSIAAHNTRIGKNNDSLISHNTRIGANTTNIATNTSNISSNTSSIALKAPLASPTFTGTITTMPNSGIVVINSANGSDPSNHRSQQYAADGSRPGLLQIKYGDYSGGSGLEIYGFGTNTGPFIHFNQAGGSDTTPTQTLSGRVIGGIASRGYTNGGLFSYSSAGWHMYAAENFTNTAQGTRQQIFNYGIGGTTRNVNLDLEANGNVRMGFQLGVHGIKDTGTLDMQADEMKVGSDGSLTTRTNSTNKAFKFLCNQYATASFFAMMVGSTTSTDNNLIIGGGTGSYNSATNVYFRTGATTTTASGTNYGVINSTGLWRLGDGTTATSTVQVAGSFAPAYIAKATSYTATISDCVIEVTATGQTITLPTAVGIQGRQYTVKLTASGSSTVATTSSQTIDGSTTYSLSAQYKYVTVQSNNANWIVIANN